MYCRTSFSCACQMLAQEVNKKHIYFPFPSGGLGVRSNCSYGLDGDPRNIPLKKIFEVV